MGSVSLVARTKWFIALASGARLFYSLAASRNGHSAVTLFRRYGIWTVLMGVACWTSVNVRPVPMR